MKRIKLIKLDEPLYSYPVLPYSGSIDGMDVWIKFASYFKDSELSFLESLEGKDISKLSQSDFRKYYTLKGRMNISELLVKYKNKECTKEEYNCVSDFMEKTDVASFIRGRMSGKEKKDASKFVDGLSKKELEEYITPRKDDFVNLSIYDAYVLLSAKERLYDIEHQESVECTMAEQSRSANHLRRSLLRDFGPF